jgi:hypothetical protein
MEQTVLNLFGLKEPKPYKGKQSPDKTTNDDLMVGLELEIENLPRGRDDYQERAGSFWAVVEDGSLRPRGEAWEFVSKPAPLGHALAELRIFFEKFEFDNSNYSDRCSVHVHTNVQDFTQQQMANLALVYPIVEPVLFRYVNHYKKQEEQGYCRDTNLYCIPWSDCRMNRNFVEQFFNSPESFGTPGVRERELLLGSSRRRWEKYTALNLLPISEHGTVEWRHMHGTADMEKLTTWLNIIGAIMLFCKRRAFEDIVNTVKVLNDVSTYQQFFTDVLGGTLPYKEEYRAPMAEGVINAKYSLINWEANKNKPKKEATAKKPVSLYGYQWNEVEAEEEEEEGLVGENTLNVNIPPPRVDVRPVADRIVRNWAAQAEFDRPWDIRGRAPEAPVDDRLAIAAQQLRDAQILRQRERAQRPAPIGRNPTTVIRTGRR